MDPYSSLPLPTNWMKKLDTKTNIVNYYNIREHTLHAQHPTVKQARESVEEHHPLPDGWVRHSGRMQDNSERVYYANSTTGQSEWDHPLLQTEINMLILANHERTAAAAASLLTFKTTARLARDCECVNLMNHHRIIAVRQSAISPPFPTPPSHTHTLPPPPTPTPPATIEFVEDHVSSRFLSFLQRSPSQLSLTNYNLFTDQRHEESLQFSYIVLHTILNPHSTESYLTTNFLKQACVACPPTNTTPSSIFTNSMWFPSTSPLVAFKTEFTYTTQTLLCYCVRSDVVNFFKHIWKKQLLPTPQFNSNNTFNTQFPTKSFKQKLSLKTNDTMMIHLVRKLLLSLFSDEAMARLPQPIVELAATLKTRNREASEILLLNLFLLPSLSILLVNKNDASYMGFNFNQFFEVTDSIFEWWDLFTSAGERAKREMATYII